MTLVRIDLDLRKGGSVAGCFAAIKAREQGYLASEDAGFVTGKVLNVNGENSWVEPIPKLADIA